MMRLKPDQCRAARALLGWSPGDLALASQVPRRDILEFEAHRRRPETDTPAILLTTLERAGVVFDAEGGCTPGTLAQTPVASEAPRRRGRRAAVRDHGLAAFYSAMGEWQALAGEAMSAAIWL